MSWLACLAPYHIHVTSLSTEVINLDWVGDFHIWGPGIRPNPSESDSLSIPSESGTHIFRVILLIQNVRYRKKTSPAGLLRIRPNLPESDPPPNPSESRTAIPVPRRRRCGSSTAPGCLESAGRACRQGLTLVHSSPQPQPFSAFSSYSTPNCMSV
jgi:hypothetical protein